MEFNSRKGEVIVKQKKFTFDRVFGPDSSQMEVYRDVVEPIVDQVLLGFRL